MIKPLTFEQRYEEICFELEKRRGKWDLGVVDWSDAKQMILVRIHEQYHRYDPRRGPFSHWVQKVITNKIFSIWRDNYTKYARPCVLGCVFNAGGDACTKTKSGRQCAECPLFRDWEQCRKKDHHTIKQPLPLENHIQEASSIDARSHASDFVDYAGAKEIIDREIKKKLTKVEWKVYRLLMIKNGDERQAAKILGFKNRRKTRTGRKLRMYDGYLAVLALRHKFVQLARTIIKDQNLA